MLERYGRIEQPPAVTEVIQTGGQGARVVGMQRVLQAHSDPFLGFLSGPESQFYVRQFHDMKGGIDADTLEDEPFVRYAQACAVTLARAHGQSGRSAEITGYAGNGSKVTAAILTWCQAYAELAAADFAL